MLPAEVLDRDAGIGLPQEPHDLRFREPLLHRPTLSARPDSKPKRYSDRGGRHPLPHQPSLTFVNAEA
jgi:hypothetical protein